MTIGTTDDAMTKAEKFPAVMHRPVCWIASTSSTKKVNWVWSTHAHATASQEKKKNPHTTRLSLYTARTLQKKSREVDDIATATVHFSAVTKCAQRAVSVVTVYLLFNERHGG